MNEKDYIIGVSRMLTEAFPEENTDKERAMLTILTDAARWAFGRGVRVDVSQRTLGANIERGSELDVHVRSKDEFRIGSGWDYGKPDRVRDSCRNHFEEYGLALKGLETDGYHAGEYFGEAPSAWSRAKSAAEQRRKRKFEYDFSATFTVVDPEQFNYCLNQYSEP